MSDVELISSKTFNNQETQLLNCFINFLKNKFKTFVSIEDISVLNQGQINQQPLQQNINNNINYSVNSVNSMNSMINSNGSFIQNYDFRKVLVILDEKLKNLTKLHKFLNKFISIKMLH